MDYVHAHEVTYVYGPPINLISGGPGGKTAGYTAKLHEAPNTTDPCVGNLRGAGEKRRHMSSLWYVVMGSGFPVISR